MRTPGVAVHAPHNNAGERNGAKLFESCTPDIRDLCAPTTGAAPCALVYTVHWTVHQCQKETIGRAFH
ncbi:MAG: hypothetical protein GF363_17520 [Chitinivibrionales bacterium]|nr:hypothetical protein [Chitinivibrionales bacterium]